MRIFNKQTPINIFLQKNGSEFILSIEGEYINSSRKSQLYTSEQALCNQLTTFWKSLKTKLVTEAVLSFNEIDYYDNMTDVYYTPVIGLRRGERKAKLVTENAHGCIPKDWSIELRVTLKTLKSMSAVYELAGRFIDLTDKVKRQLAKELRPVIKGEKNNGSWDNYDQFNN